MKAINSKREQYRRDIIKKQKEEFFNKKRQELLRNLHYPEGIINPIEELRQRNKVKEAFEYLKKKIAQSDYFVNIVKFVDEGMINVLISFLKQGREVEETLEIINDIFNKKELDYYGTFYNYGLLEYVFNYFQASPKISAQCMQILLSFTTKSNDYSQSLMINNKHHAIMQEMMNRINASRDPQQENLNEGEMYFTFTLFVLEELIKIKESTFDFTQEKLAIFNFVMILVQRRLFLKQTLGFLYQCVNQLQRTSNISGFILPLVKIILSQAKIDDKYLYNLFALIYAMMLNQPIDLNFPQFFKIGILVNKLQKPFVYILGKIISYDRPYCDVIPKNQEFWERMLISPESNNLHCQMLRILESLQIKKSWIWKVYSSALSQDSLEIQNQSITILNRLIRSPELGQDILTYLNLHRIPKLLEHLTHAGKSQSLKDSANNLLEYILGPLTEQSSEQAL